MGSFKEKFGVLIFWEGDVLGQEKGLISGRKICSGGEGCLVGISTKHLDLSAIMCNLYRIRNTINKEIII